jgi:predicted nucleic acid-binding protein
MRVLVDTNILLRSAQPTHPLCPQATHTVSTLLRQKDAVFFCSQNIAEFWNVATRPVEMNGLGACAQVSDSPLHDDNSRMG